MYPLLFGSSVLDCLVGSIGEHTHGYCANEKVSSTFWAWFSDDNEQYMSIPVHLTMIGVEDVVADRLDTFMISPWILAAKCDTVLPRHD